MLNTKSFLTVDFGAGSLKLAEFEIDEAGGLRLKNFAIKPLGLEGSQEATREKIILQALQEAIADSIAPALPGGRALPNPGLQNGLRVLQMAGQ